MFRQHQTYEEALEAFEHLEQDLGLPEWTVNGIYVWKLLRFRLFAEYRQRLEIMQAVHPEMVRLKRRKMRMVWDVSKPLLFRNPFLKVNSRSRRVIIPHSRKREYAGQYVDPISYPAWQLPYGHGSTVLDKTSPLYPFALPGAPSFEVLAGLAWLRSQAVRVRLNHADRWLSSEIERRLHGPEGSANFDLVSRVENTVKAFVGLKSVFSTYFRRTQPDYLYVVVGYGCQAPIAAAHGLGIETVEFQHGSLGRGHIGYDFKEWSYVPYFPRRMLAFGTAWFENVHFPEACAVEPIGYPALEEAISSARARVERNPTQLLVLSQGPIADAVVETAAKFAEMRTDWDVVIRPHPSESADVLRRYMSEVASSDNWRIEKGPSLEEHAAASSAVLGVNSTALVEALLGGCRVALLDNTSSADYLDKLATRGNATRVKSGRELADMIDHIGVGSARGFFAEPVRDVIRYVEGAASN